MSCDPEGIDFGEDTERCNAVNKMLDRSCTQCGAQRLADNATRIGYRLPVTSVLIGYGEIRTDAAAAQIPVLMVGDQTLEELVRRVKGF